MYEKPIKKTISVALPIEVYDRLKGYAAEAGRFLSGEIRQILKGYLEYLDRGGVSWCKNGRNRGMERYEGAVEDAGPYEKIGVRP